jgi:hypothetical protein
VSPDGDTADATTSDVVDDMPEADSQPNVIVEFHKSSSTATAFRNIRTQIRRPSPTATVPQHVNLQPAVSFPLFSCFFSCFAFFSYHFTSTTDQAHLIRLLTLTSTLHHQTAKAGAILIFLSIIIVFF